MKPNIKYNTALKSIPAPGGNGCHTALLGVANHGVMAGLADEQIFNDIRNWIPEGNRPVPDGEIRDAVRKARQDVVPSGSGRNHKPVPATQKPRPAVKSEYLQSLLERGKNVTERDIANASSVSIPNSPEQHPFLLLDSLYSPDDNLFIGGTYDTEVQPVREWIRHITANGTNALPHVIPNPLTGSQHKTKSGKMSFRCDAAVKDFRFAVVEFDNLSREDQLAFWAAVPLPVAALIDSGGKSIHGWIRIAGVNSEDEWSRQVETELYARRLVPLGVDPACRNESRLSRLPGHYRAEKQRWQRLLYLNPEPTCKPFVDDRSNSAHMNNN